MRLVGILAALLLVVLVLEHVGLRLLQRRIVYVAQKAQYRLRYRIYDKLHALPMSYHDEHTAGRLTTHLFSDVETVQQATIQLLRQIPMNLVMMAIGLVVIFRIDVGLSCLVMLALPAYALCYTFFHRRLKVVHENLRERQGRLNGHIANRIKHFYLVKSFCRETSEGIAFLRKARPIIRDTIAASVLNTFFTITCGIITGVCMVAVLWLGALQVRDGRMTLGTLLLFYASAGCLFTPVAGISNLASIYHRLCVVCRKVMRVLDEPIALADPVTAVPVPTEAPALRFSGVSLRYDPNRPPALRDISFVLPAGRTMCVMGSSGAGKTTLAKLACRMYDPTDGEVHLGDIDIRQFKLARLREVVGYVNQEPVIFDGTIRDNIRYGSEQSSLGQMVTAARFAQIHDHIVTLPDRYDTITAERGLTLSGGQKQRVNLARVLLYDPKLLVLDDCTSALDADTEVRLIKAFETILTGRTAMLVSHRISIAMQCDYVLVLEDGGMVEFGPPGDLLTQNGAFRTLYDEQGDKKISQTLHVSGNA